MVDAETAVRMVNLSGFGPTENFVLLCADKFDKI